MISRIVEPLLRPFDHEGNELILRWRLWKMRWFPYRLAELKGMDEETGELIMGPWKWYLPRKFEKKRGAQGKP